VSERFEGFEFPRSKANNIPVVAFILEPIIVPVLERKDTTLAEKAACDLFMRPHLAYFKHTVQKARNLPKDCDVVIKTLDFALEKESSKLVMCGEIELGGANSLIIRSCGRYSLRIGGFGVGEEELQTIVDANTRDKSRSKVSDESTYKVDIRNKRLKNVVGGLEVAMEVDVEVRATSDDGILSFFDFNLQVKLPLLLL
jgi:hypothetical protein